MEDWKTEANALERVEDVELGSISKSGSITKPEFQDIAAEVEAIERDPQNKKTFRKVNFRIIMVLGIVYSISVIDRINIGQARVIGMNEDLGLLIGARYSICLLVYFPTAMVFEFLGNPALIKFGVARTMAVMTLGVAVITIAQGHVQNWQTLAAMRALLGAFEASIFPAQVFIIASWYPRYEAHRILSGMYAIGLLASAFAGVLAYGIGNGMYGLQGLKGWRWVFTIEGVASVLVALIPWFFLDDMPDRSKFLSPEEKAVVMRRLVLDRSNVETEQISIKNLKDLKDGIIWLATGLYVCNVVAVYGLAFFVPSILMGLGYSGLLASLYSAWPYFVAIGFLFISATLGDKYKRRLPIIMVQACICIIGLALMGQIQLSPQIRYFGVFLAISGCQSNNSAILIFGQNNIVGSSKMNITAMLTIAGASVSGIIGSTIFRTQDAPKFAPGFGTAMALQAAVVVLAAGAWFVLWKKNKEAEEKRLELQPGDIHWRYTL